jgi:AcrR family transcriptional regulator
MQPVCDLATVTYRQHVCDRDIGHSVSAKAERSEATRAKLLAAGRELFAERGYAGVGTEEIVASAGVTRGALYHHFADKRDLFRAVHESMEEELVGRIGAALAEVDSDDPMDALRAAVPAFLDLAANPGLARITLVEAPSVLGWAEWREIDTRYGLGLAEAALGAAIEAGRMPDQPVRPLAHLLLAAMGEAGIMVATAADPAAARREVEPALISFVEGLVR